MSESDNVIDANVDIIIGTFTRTPVGSSVPVEVTRSAAEGLTEGLTEGFTNELENVCDSMDMEEHEVGEPNMSEPTSQNNQKTPLMSEDNKIREAVVTGSVYLALESKFFTAKSLLEWLTTVEIVNRTRVAYKAVCAEIHPDDQYLDDSYHFLTKKPEYLSIALLVGLDTEIDDRRESNGCYNPLLARVVEQLLRVNSDVKLRQLSMLICNGGGSEPYIRSNLNLCYSSRVFPHLRTVTNHQINVSLVIADWTARLRYNEKLPGLILHRVARLQERAPLYYAQVAYQAYHKVVVKLNRDKLLTRLTRDELFTLNTFFPNIIDAKIFEYTDLAYKIALLGNDMAGYVLGFPIQNMIPNDEQIHEALCKLKELGVEGYVNHIKEYVSKTYRPVLPFPQQEEPIYPNKTDVLYEDINDYVPFDIIACQIGQHIHRFSRAEAENLLETKKNPWSGEWLPSTVLSTIKARVSASEELGLPNARPLNEILTRINEGKLMEEDVEPEPPSPNDPPLFALSPPPLFSLSPPSPLFPNSPPSPNSPPLSPPPFPDNRWTSRALEDIINGAFLSSQRDVELTGPFSDDLFVADPWIPGIPSNVSVMSEQHWEESEDDNEDEDDDNSNSDNNDDPMDSYDDSQQMNDALPESSSSESSVSLSPPSASLAPDISISREMRSPEVLTPDEEDIILVYRNY